MTKAISVRRARKARRCDGGCGEKLEKALKALPLLTVEECVKGGTT